MGPFFIAVGASALVLWILFFVVCFLVVASLENDAPQWATTSIVVTIGLLWFFTDFSKRYDVIHFITWYNVLIFGSSYILLGIVWSFFKWYLELSERRERWDEAVRSYRKTYSVPKDIPVGLKDSEFAAYIRKNHYSDFCEFKSGEQIKIQIIPEPNKPRIIGWMVYWPWSLLWSILDDFITGIFKWVYRHLVGGYEGLARYMFRGIE